MLADTGAVEGDWLVALAQDAGRGRQGREWVSQTGNFFGSTLVELKRADPPAPSLSLAAGLALIEAVDLVAPEHQLMLKWPNDLMLGQAKVAGVLLERSGDRVVAGFGVNLASAPELPDRQAAALDGGTSPQAFAPLLAGSLSRLLNLWRTAEEGALARAWQARAHAVGTPIAVHIAEGETITGTFAGIETDGALRLRRPDGELESVHAGDVLL